MTGRFIESIIVTCSKPVKVDKRAFVAPLSSARRGLGELKIEYAQLTQREIIDLKRDPSTNAVVPAMPLRLIRPLKKTVSENVIATSTWGVEATNAHISKYDGSEVVVAVLDTGIFTKHEAFKGIELVTKNFTEDSDADIDGHGTHCAGTIFGRDVDGLRIGIARGVKKALIGKVIAETGSSSIELVKAIQWAYEGGANIISMSLGIDYPGHVKDLIKKEGYSVQAATSIALEEYLANVKLFSSITSLLSQSEAFSHPAVVVAASGNESKRPKYEIGVAPPAVAEDILSVGALRRMSNGDLKVASFSNTQCDISGPGVGIISAGLDTKKSLVSCDGTSMAAPHVTGCAALWAQRLTELERFTVQNLLSKLLGSALHIEGADGKDVGIGVVQAP